MTRTIDVVSPTGERREVRVEEDSDLRALLPDMPEEARKRLAFDLLAYMEAEWEHADWSWSERAPTTGARRG